MSETKTAWTPGPWEAVVSDSRGHMSWVRDPSARDGANSIALVGASELEEEQANVQLIAAAPDLYEACRIARLHADSIRLAPERRHAIAVLDAALAKARGEPAT